MEPVNATIPTPHLMYKVGKKFFVVRLREVGGAGAQCQLDLFKDVLEDVGGSLSKGIGNENFYKWCFQKYKKFDVRLLCHTQKN